MTTMTIIVVVALVFFAALCVITLLIWKRETEMRTDSLKAIEQNLERVIRELSDRHQLQRRRERLDNIKEHAGESTGQNEEADPFAWVKTQETNDGKCETDNGGNIPEETVPEDISDIDISEIKGMFDKIIEEIVLPDITQDAAEDQEISDQSATEGSGRSEELQETEESLDDQYLDLLSTEIEEQPVRGHMGYDTGRSGRKYTAEELEMLIKE